MLFNKQSNIFIIGAGIAGIHMAIELKKRGFSKIQLLEKSDHVGGKLSTIHLNDQVLDIGAVGIPYESSVYTLCQTHDCELIPFLKQYKIFNGRFNQFRHRRNGIKTKFLMWLIKMQMQKFEGILKQYEQQGFPHTPQDHLLKILSIPFSIFLNNHKLGLLNKFFNVCAFDYGYGRTEDIPTFYGLLYFKVWGNAFINLDVYILKQGYQTLCQRLAEIYDLDIKFNTEITKIKYSSENKSLDLTCKTSKKIQSFTPDFLINSVPYIVSEAFPPTLSYDYIVAIISFNHDKYCDVAFFFSRHFTEDHVNLAMNQTLMRGINHGRDVVFYWNKSELAKKGLDCENEPIINHYIQKTLQHELNTFYHIDASEYEISFSKQWHHYFPQFLAHDLSTGITKQIWENQGSRQCWNIGAACCFDSVPNIINYNLDLLKHHNL